MYFFKKENTRDVYEFIKDLLRNIIYPRLELNDDKTLFLSKAGSRRITGVVLNNDDQLSLGRDRKRDISVKVHYFKNGKLSPAEVYQLQGLLAFAKDIEPKFIDRLAAKYGKEYLLKLGFCRSDEES